MPATDIQSGDFELRHVTMSYGRLEVLHETSFAPRRGQICGLLGTNGAGKSTTLRILAGLTRPTQGEVLLDGTPVYDNLDAFKRRLGYVPEEALVYRHLSGREYLELVGGLRNLSPATLHARIQGLLRAFDLAADADTWMEAYSKGMRQKILLSAALLHDPEILILDEPFSGLDIPTGLLVRHLFVALAARGRMILLSSHELGVVETLSDRVLVLHGGRLVADNRVAQLREALAAPTLEAVFTALTDRRDLASAARSVADLLAEEA